MKNKRIALISGASSGIGYETALLLLKEDYHVVNLSRRDFTHPNIEHIKCDVTDKEQVEKAVAQVIAKYGVIDLLVCAAGYGIAGAIEFTKEDDFKRQIDVNFFGTVHLVQASLAHMRKEKSGRIICLSSVAGVISIPFQAFYSISKSAINSFVTALSHEVRPFNIKVTALMPGDTKTAFTASRVTNLAGNDLYENRIGKSIEVMEKDEMSGDNPKDIAKDIVKISKMKHPLALYTAGFKYKVFVLLQKLLPQRLISKIIFMMYAK